MTKPVLNVQLLGGFSLQLDGEPLEAMPTRPASVFAYLILHRDRDHTRDLLAGRFWSETTDDKARRRLSQALWRIRAPFKAAEIEPLVSSANTIRFNPEIDVQLDVEVFEADLDRLERRSSTGARDELAAAIGRYRGDLLAGHYDDWIGDERQRLQDRYRDGLSLLIRLATKEGDYEAALRHALALVADEPLDEEAQREVLRLYAMNGRITAAERHYRQFAAELEEQLHVEPAPETEKLMTTLIDESAPPMAVEVEHAPAAFVGRRQERSALLRGVIDLAAGKGGILLVEGETGIGKTRLVEELAGGAEWREVNVLIGRHDDASPLTPYDGLRQALAPALTGLRRDHLRYTVDPLWLTEAADVLQSLKGLVEGPDRRHRLQPEEEPWRTTEAVAQIILAQGKPRPTVLILEDVHLCDHQTMAVLAQLGDRLLDSQVLLCLTYRLDEARLAKPVWDLLSDLEAEPGASRVRVPPLEPDETRELIAAELGPGAMSGAVVDQIIELTNGNPSMVLELVRSPDLGDDGRSDGTSSPQRLEDELMPRLTAVVSRRVEAAPPDVRAVLEGVAIVGASAPSATVAHVVQLDESQANQALQQAVRLGFLDEDARGCSFARSQTRQIVYDALPDDRRRNLHARMADAIATSIDGPASIAVIARHAWLGQQWQRAYQYHSLASESALRINAYHIAAEHFDKSDEAALRAGLVDSLRVDEMLDAEMVFDVLGERERQRQLVDRVTAVGQMTDRRRLAVLQRQAMLVLHENQPARAIELATEAVAFARRSEQDPGDALTIVASARIRAGQRSGAIEPLEQAVAAHRAAGVSAVTPQLMLGRVYAELGDLGAAQRFLEDAFDEAKETDDARNRVEALGHLATMWTAKGVDSKAEAAFQQALAEAQDIGYRDGEGKNLLNLAVFNVLRGRSGRAAALYARARAVYASLHDDRGVAYAQANHAWVLHWIVGDDNAARQHAEAAAVELRKLQDARTEAVCLTTLGNIDRRAGRRRQARNRFRRALDQAASAEDRLTEAKVRVSLALVELDLDNVDDALEHAIAADKLRVAHRLDILGPLAGAVLGRARLRVGQVDQVLRLVDRVIATNHQGAELSHLAAWWVAEILAAVDRHDEASDQVARAHDLLSRNVEELSKSDVVRSWTEIPEHRAIAMARERYFIETVTLRLPIDEAPTGRPLAPKDFVTVTLTRSHPDDWDVDSPAERRQRRTERMIDEASRQGTRIRQSDLAKLLGVSERTVKRDLAQGRDPGEQNS